MGIEFAIAHLIILVLITLIPVIGVWLTIQIKCNRINRTFIISANGDDLEIFEILLSTIYKSNKCFTKLHSKDVLEVRIPKKLTSVQMIKFIASLEVLEHGYLYAGFKYTED